MENTTPVGLVRFNHSFIHSFTHLLIHIYLLTLLSGTGGSFRVLRSNNDEITTVSVTMAVKSDPTTAYSMNYMLGVLINDVLYNKYEGNAS